MDSAALTAFCQGLEAAAAALSVRRLDRDETLRSDPAACVRAVPPAGSYQIPLLVMARETAVIEGPATRLPYNPDLYPAARLRHPVDAAEAWREDCEWFFVELAFRVDVDRASAFVKEWSYGNEKVGAFEPPFWVSGDLLISADQQVEFLGRLYEADLPVDSAASGLVLDLMRRPEPSGGGDGDAAWRALSRETLLPTESTTFLTWHVGTLARGERRLAYALWVQRATGAANLPGEASQLRDLLATALG